MLPRRPRPRHAPDPRTFRLETALRGLAVAGPDPGFEGRLRTRLVAVGTVAGARTPPVPSLARTRSRLARHPRWLPRAVAAGAAGVVGVAGLGVATSRALPGQPLYAAKRQIESWQLSLASGPADRGREQLAFARTRLAEVEALSHHHDLTAAAGPSAAAAGGSISGRIATTLRRMDAETRAGTSDLAIAAQSGDDAAAQQLLAFADGQSARLREIAPRLPAPVASAVSASRTVLRQVAALARTLPGAPAASSATTPAPAPTAAPPHHPSARRPDAAPTATATATTPGPSVVRGEPPGPSATPSSPAWWRYQSTRHPTPSPTGQPSDPTLLGVPPSSITGLLSGGQSGDG